MSEPYFDAYVKATKRIASLESELKQAKEEIAKLKKQAEGLCDICGEPLDDAYCVACAVNPVLALKQQLADLQREKDARIYYQGIVYGVCNALDKINHRKPGTGIVCGTLEEPSHEVQEAMADLQRQIEEAKGKIDLVAHLSRQRQWSEATFGPDVRIGVIEHIRKELAEIENNPTDLFEWIDVVILGFDGAWRAGWTPEQIVQALIEKQTTNELRKWPDWRTVPNGKAIEHIKPLLPPEEEGK